MSRKKEKTSLEDLAERNVRYLGEKLVELRKNSNLRQYCVSDYIGASESTVRRMDVGDPGVSMRFYMQYFDILGIADECLELFKKAAADRTRVNITLKQCRELRKQKNIF